MRDLRTHGSLAREGRLASVEWDVRSFVRPVRVGGPASRFATGEIRRAIEAMAVDTLAELRGWVAEGMAVLPAEIERWERILQGETRW